jgi:hypothetical protein
MNTPFNVICTDTDIDTDRVDARKDRVKVTTLTQGKTYQVIDVDRSFYRVINDVGKSARYISLRFTKTCLMP